MMNVEELKLLWTQSGCIKCEDYKNAGLYDKLIDLQEHSLEDSEGLSLACFYEMWNKKGTIDTPCIYVGKDMFGDSKAIRIAGEDVKIALENSDKDLRLGKRNET